jgi:hypothetical protein
MRKNYGDTFFQVYDTFSAFSVNRNNQKLTGQEYINENILNLSRAVLVYEDSSEKIIFLEKISSWCRNNKLKLMDFDFPFQSKDHKDDLPHLLRDDVEDPKNSLLFIKVNKVLTNDEFSRIIEFANYYSSFRVFIYCQYSQVKSLDRKLDFVPIKWANIIGTVYPDFEEDSVLKNINMEELQQIVRNSLEQDTVRNVIQSKEFYFELLRIKWNEFSSLDFESPAFISTLLLNRKLPSSESEFKDGKLVITFSDLLSEFEKSEKTFQIFFSELEEGSLKYYVFSLIGQLISYFDSTGYNRNEWNEYSDKRAIAKSGVNQTLWVKHLLRYKTSKNNLEIVSNSIYNAIMFVINPTENLTMLSEKHREQFSEIILNQVYNLPSFSREVFEFFNRFEINVNNIENRGIVITQIIYSEPFRVLWDTKHANDQNPEPELVSENNGGGGGNNITNDSIDSENRNNENNRFSVFQNNNMTITEDSNGVIGVNELSSVMANLLKNLKEEDKGKMVGIFGNWGRGKTFLMDKIWGTLQKDKTEPFIRVNFHAWKYQDTPASWAYLYEAFATAYFKDDSKNFIVKEWNKFFKKLQLNWEKIGWRPIIFLIVSVIATAISFFIIKDIQGIKRLLLFFGAISITSVQLLSFLKKSFSEKAKDLFKKYYTKTSFSNLLGIQSEIQKELKYLLKNWIKANKDGSMPKRILLFVDDIDRCSEDRIMTIIDALRIMLEDDEISKRVVVLAAIDERVLKRAIKCKYHELLSKDYCLEDSGRKNLSLSITTEYMDKLFLSGISLGMLTTDDKKEILKKYIQNRVHRPKQIITNVSNNLTSSQTQIGSIATERNNSNEFNAKPNTPLNEKETNSKNQEQPKQMQIVDESQYDLSETEEQFLFNHMEFYKDATPRQIRIFYYRYLLGRNLLINQFRAKNLVLNNGVLENLGFFLLHYSTHSAGLDKLKSAKIDLIDTSGVATNFELFGDNRVYNTQELTEIHKVLEIVIAY